jgi:hypothetical protein
MATGRQTKRRSSITQLSGRRLPPLPAAQGASEAEPLGLTARLVLLDMIAAVPGPECGQVAGVNPAVRHKVIWRPCG